MKEATAPVAEIFVSVQGEGLYCGQRQIFFRFFGCNLHCSYCDEPAAVDGKHEFLTVAQAVKTILCLSAEKNAKNISFTGGEPLLYWAFIKKLAPQLKKHGIKIHLETNGTLPDELSKLKRIADVVAMDIKLPSSGNHKSFWSKHLEFLKVLPKKIFVKTVITRETEMKDFKHAVKIISAVNTEIPFFIQPATYHKKGPKAPTSKFTGEACCAAAEKLQFVRVLPQQHPIWGIK